jgi:hypothetical protein
LEVGKVEVEVVGVGVVRGGRKGEPPLVVAIEGEGDIKLGGGPDVVALIGLGIAVVALGIEIPTIPGGTVVELGPGPRFRVKLGIRLGIRLGVGVRVGVGLVLLCNSANLRFPVSVKACCS